MFFGGLRSAMEIGLCSDVWTRVHRVSAVPDLTFQF